MVSSLVSAAESAPARLALVIAIGDYKALPALPQCPLAARNMAAALRDTGFEVSEAINVGNGAMNAALTSFAEKAPAKAILTVYFCGYAAVYNGRSFLLPVSAELVSPDRVMSEGVITASLLSVMGRANPSQAIALADVTTPPGKSDPASEAAFTITNPPPATTMLAISQPVPGSLGNALAGRLRAPELNLRALLQGARNDWSGQPATTVAITALPEEAVYLRGGPTAASSPTPPTATTGLDAERQMSEPERRRVQSRLRALGFYDGPIDGIFGDQTREAIRRFQSAKGMAATGRLGVTEAAQLLFFDPTR